MRGNGRKPKNTFSVARPATRRLARNNLDPMVVKERPRMAVRLSNWMRREAEKLRDPDDYDKSLNGYFPRARKLKKGGGKLA